ncbi:ATP-dependent DNA helicase PcrA [Geoalkalibacter ferrihydriticus]|nr:UvrD-helicase domain-containing protein [Geoalkalibacter ferrihydriticus]SDM49092.1 ATP-dependent DNA helicase PcrA [Geoalkalibacter ferrihydriticus]
MKERMHKQDVAHDLLAELNPMQRQAVQHGEGPLLILAGAGSGKTRTLTQRVAWLIREQGVAPWQILAVTFTNKAAGEMRSRIEKLLGGGESPWVSTFHSLCVRILRREISALGYTSDFTIYDDQDQERLLREVLRELNVSEKLFKPRAAASAIDACKNRGLLPEEIERDDHRGEQVARIYDLYQKRLRQANALDFGDLIMLCAHLLQQEDAVLRRWQGRFRHVLVDEFQDTNAVQYQLTRLLAGGTRNLCVVGDDDQSIYRWRGAEVGNILGFERDYPEAAVIRLEQNYRSTRTILDAAGEVVAQNRGRKGKTLWTENPQGDAISLETLPDDREEARFIVDEIDRLRRNGRHLRDLAVLYRTNAQSRPLEEALVEARIPYVMIGGIKFFSRMEIKDVLAYLRVLVNPADSISARRIINVPARGIGNASVARIAQYEEDAGGFLPACRMALERGVLGAAATRRVLNFVEMMEGLRAKLAQLPYPELTNELIEASGYGPALREEGTEEARERLRNLEQLLAGMEEHRSSETGLHDFLEQVALVTDLDSYDGSLDRVTLMTLHAAKGLEYPVVFMTGMEEGLFPHSRAGSGGEELEEERRLCYVGMTRAMEKLYLSHARRRRIYGDYQFNPPSPFLAEIPTELLAQTSPASAPALAKTAGHNLASVFEQMGRAPAASSSGAAAPVVGDEFEEEVQVVPEAEEGLRIGTRVRHPKFGVGLVRRLEGSGDNQKVTVYFSTAGPKKLLLKFAGLEPA